MGKVAIPDAVLRKPGPLGPDTTRSWMAAGYPFGLRGEQISLEARIVAVADIDDALTEARVYKPALSEEESVRILNDMVQAHHLDPLGVAALLEAREQRQAIAAAYRDP